MTFPVVLLSVGGGARVVLGGGLALVVGIVSVPGVSGPTGPSVSTSLISGPVPSSGGVTDGDVLGGGETPPENKFGKARARQPRYPGGVLLASYSK